MGVWGCREELVESPGWFGRDKSLEGPFDELNDGVCIYCVVASELGKIQSSLDAKSIFQQLLDLS